MFDQIGGLLDSLFSDIQSTFITLFVIGIMILGLLTAFGGQESQGKFKGGLIFCIGGLAVFILAPAIVDYFQNNL